MAARCVALAAVTFFLAVHLSQQTSQCFPAILQFSMNNPGLIPSFCQNEILERFNDQGYRIDFTQEEVEDICQIDLCLPYLQEVGVYCKTFVSLEMIVTVCMVWRVCNVCLWKLLLVSEYQ